MPKSKQKSILAKKLLARKLLELSNLIFETTPAATSTSTAYPRLLDLSYLNLNRVSNINSKNSEIPFKLAKNKRKVSINLVKKNKKINP